MMNMNSGKEGKLDRELGFKTIMGKFTVLDFHFIPLINDNCKNDLFLSKSVKFVMFISVWESVYLACKHNCNKPRF